MDRDSYLTIITATYNRGNLIKNLYESLAKQTNQNFQWLIIDDGSNDNTKQIVKKFNNNKFIISYHYKTNGGKHTALNYSQKFIKGNYIAMVDSDDTLTKNAIDEIYKTIKKYKGNEEIACISFQKSENGYDPLVKNIKNNTISNHISYRINKNKPGDCFEVLKTEIFKKYKFPEYKNETFLSEGYLWAKIAKEYKTLYINKILYIGRYLEGGLTKRGRKNRLKNPLGGMAAANEYLSAKWNPRLNIIKAFRYTILFTIYGKTANMSRKQIVQNCNRPFLAIILYPLSMIIYKSWINRYE